MALDWTLSRRQIVDFGAPPHTWEQNFREIGIWDFMRGVIRGTGGYSLHWGVLAPNTHRGKIQVTNRHKKQTSMKE